MWRQRGSRSLGLDVLSLKCLVDIQVSMLDRPFKTECGAGQTDRSWPEACGWWGRRPGMWRVIVPLKGD